MIKKNKMISLSLMGKTHTRETKDLKLIQFFNLIQLHEMYLIIKIHTNCQGIN
jgi:hypothetical protein